LHHRKHSPAVEEALAVRERLDVAATTADLDTLRQLLSADLVVSDPGNRIRRRDDLISLFQRGAVSYSSVASSVDFAEQIGELVVVMGTTETVLQSSPPGTPWPPGTKLCRRFTDVFRKESGSWRLLVRQSTVFKTE
jgi:ketosteroid isomerase-like protein